MNDYYNCHSCAPIGSALGVEAGIYKLLENKWITTLYIY
ncbi:MAG: hypothetical protein ACD_3C00129G0001 [uncultured bacterium (gcode 4)]|uniref:Uncharacterized protein n=1 Tax=uncultured bacterium (gcode 4) TaxID=1234023 RepID=K2GCD4_9BACT|nr:MAG: hypothetical protein ACD_3C00129G0001 [uncultured bacterium (gcode 4)]